MTGSKSANEIDAHVGRRIVLRRKNLDMTQAALAAAIGTSNYQLAKYERGMNRVGASRLQEIADALKVHAAWFFADDPMPAFPLQSTSNTDLELRFTSSSQERELNAAFEAISNPPLRAQIIALVSALAAEI
ncbi:helix-turn-helix domain-containing protein [Rhizobiales bacterium RZME27]|uniref:Helix-turn-helix domain-containing protein n=1 Tax=Endobacterium cereale TaxID=2663029 RepID=A0A6A8ACP4_9HYPH|nr:helix-turn-helix domain-containing protein [Endobacterium cereale]MEB2846780.1 helix-turn-helix domain-containing protein [Endobacterium cereale]MQY46501.1 helix-turn-helix domain-containing protein [Endobacterium cereale]